MSSCAVGRKRKLTNKEVANLHECLAVPCASEKVVLQIWNIANQLRADATNASTSTLKVAARQRLRDARACYEEWRVPGTEETIWMPRAPDLFQFLLDESPAWREALVDALNVNGGILRPVIYHDDITCGNILAVIKKKKVTAVYLALKEMFPHVTLEAAWMPLMVLQRIQQDKIPGGLSAVMAELVRRLALAGEGFNLAVNGQVRRCAFARPFLFLSDVDAQRATWSIKGSAGLKPCMFCANVISKNALRGPHAAFETIASSAFEKFKLISDFEFQSAVRHLETLPTKAAREQWEKVYGLTWDPHSLLAQEDALQCLPPSSACNDVLHAYFSNGVASVELWQLANALNSCGIDLTNLRGLALEKQWLRYGMNPSPSQTFIKYILSDKMFDSERSFKGDETATQPLVFLLWYVLCEHVETNGHLRPAMKSFESLHACVRELRVLRKFPGTVRTEQQVARLRGLQSLHQEDFNAAYGAETAIPKHHHRFHIPDGALKLGFLPHCETHESKHRCLKSGKLVDNQKGKLNEHAQFQYEVVTRMLEVTRNQSIEFGLARWEILGKTKPACQMLCAEFQDDTLVCGKRMQLRETILTENQPILIESKAYVAECQAISAAAKLAARGDGSKTDMRKEFSALKEASGGGTKLAYFVMSEKLFGLCHILQICTRPIWSFYTSEVKNTLNQSDSLDRSMSLQTMWKREEHLQELAGVPLSQDPQLVRLISEKHMWDTGDKCLHLIFHLLSRRTWSFVRHSAPPECYAGILSLDEVLRQDDTMSCHVLIQIDVLIETAQKMSSDFAALVQLEQATANSRSFPRILDDMQLVLTPPVRLMFLAFEADAFRPSSQAGCHFLKGMVATVPDSKIIEDLHGVIRLDGLSQKNRRQTLAQIQELVTQAHVLSQRGICHKAVVDKETFLRSFKRTPDRKRTRPGLRISAL
eukprot:s3343_g6.t1